VEFALYSNETSIESLKKSIVKYELSWAMESITRKLQIIPYYKMSYIENGVLPPGVAKSALKEMPAISRILR
jgi:hypothetical protein